MAHDVVERNIRILNKSYKFVGTKDDGYFQSIVASKGAADQDIIHILSSALTSDSWVIDVGANIGYISLVLSELCPGGRVFAFEPGKAAYQLLQKNVRRNKVRNVKPVKAGLSDTSSSVRLSYRANDLSGAFVNSGVLDKMAEIKNEVIKLERLDDVYASLGIDKCTLIKVDVEGHEPNFLKGASKFIHKFKPEIIMEANHWCLNVFNRMSLPDFIDLTYKYFPYLFAFHGGEYLDLNDTDARFKFYYENCVNFHFTNIYCGYDQNTMTERLNANFRKVEETQQFANQNLNLSHENDQLNRQLDDLQKQLMAYRNSRPQKIAENINKLLGR